MGFCAKGTPSPLALCRAGDLGAELVHVAANETASLHPAHTYVPWVVVEGVAIGSAHPFLRQFVCVALPPSDRPESCSIPGQAEVGSSRATLQLA